MKTGEELSDSEKTGTTEKDSLNEQLKALSERLIQLEKEAKSKESQSKSINHNDVASIAAVIAEAQKIISKDRDIDYRKGVAVEQVPAEDFDEKGVRFASPFVGYIISDDKRKGHIVVLPYNKEHVFFSYAGTRRTRTGKFEQTHPISTYESHSKKEIQWLREHSMYGAEFFESTTQASLADSSKAARMAQILVSLKGYEMVDLMKRCRENNIPLSEDASIMRMALANKLCVNEIEQEAATSKRILEETYKTKELLNSK